MSISPAARGYGCARARWGSGVGAGLTVTGASRTFPFDANQAINVNNCLVFPDGHIDGQTINMQWRADVAGLLEGGFGAVAIIEDGVDPVGDFTTTAGGGVLSSGVVAYIELLSWASAGNITTGTFTIGDNSDPAGLGGSINPPLAKGGTYRVVVTVGGGATLNDRRESCRRMSSVDNGATSVEYHNDSDNNERKGTASVTLITPTLTCSGLLARNATLASVTPSVASPQVYPNQPTITATLAPTTAGSGFCNPRQIRVNIDDATDGLSPAKGPFDVTPSTAGVATTAAYNVDTAFPAALTAHNIHVGVNATLGNATTPAGQQSAFANGFTIVGLTGAGQQAWVRFATALTGHGATIVAPTADRCYKPALNVGSGITLFEDAGLTIPGAAPFSTSGYTTRQEVFRRTGPTVTTNAVPFLETRIVNAAGGVLATVAVTANVLRGFDSVVANTQALTTEASGRLRWNFTVAATAPAFSRFVKAGSARQTGSHTATGPDSIGTPPATFVFGASDHPADYPGPYPAYPRTVQIVGRAFAGVNEPSVSDPAVFGVSSEIIFEDLGSWASNAVAAMDANGVPTGAGTREQPLGGGSLKAKVCSLVNEGTGRIITLGEHNPKTVAGKNIVVTTDNLFGRRALFDDTTNLATDPGSNLSDSQQNLSNSIGYNGNANSLDSIAAPTDPAALILYHGYADTTAQRLTLALTVAADLPIIGFTGDAGNFGWIAQPLSFFALDSSIATLMTSEVIQSDPTLVRRFVLKVVRVTADDQFADVAPDAAPIYAVYTQSASGPMTLVASGSAIPIGGSPTANYEFNVTMPLGVSAVKVIAFSKVNGSRTIGGASQPVQVGYTFDAVAFAAGLPFK